MQDFFEDVSKLGIKVIDLHASGYASENAIKKLIAKVNHKNVIFVHTDGSFSI